MVTDEDFLEKEDVYILNRMKEFLQNEDVSKILAAKQLLSLVERAVSPALLVWFKLSDSDATARRRHQEGLDSYSRQSTALDTTQAQQEVETFGHRLIGIGKAVDDYGESFIPEDTASGMSAAFAGAKDGPQR